MHGRVGFVVAHPAHLLTAMGMILRWKPKVLFLTHAFSGAGAGQADLIRRVFQMAGVADQITDLEVNEAESYRHALKGDFDFHLSQIPRIKRWLQSNQIETVVGDAFELSNYQHDVGRLLLDNAIDEVRAEGQPIANFEIPLSVQASTRDAKLVFGQFIQGSFLEFALSPPESKTKREIVDFAMRQDSFVAHAAPQFSCLDIEQYRAVPSDRNYQSPPFGLSMYYDQLGQEVVAAGRYSKAISFTEHFRPLVLTREDRKRHLAL